MPSHTRSAPQRARLSPPIIPLENEHNEIDVDALNGEPLEALIKDPLLKPYDDVYAVWRGVDPAGEPFDQLGAATTVPADYDPEVGFRIVVPNRYVEPAKGGYAFYSFMVNEQSADAESMRKFCFLGLRDHGINEQLPVVQARESHDLTIVWDDLETTGARFYVPAYQAMQPGDEVTLTFQGHDASGQPRAPVEDVYSLQADDIGKPLHWNIEKSKFTPIRGGTAVVDYQIALKGQAAGPASPPQVFNVTRAASPRKLLPAVSIDGHAGGAIDPGRFPAGLMVRVPAYADLKVGDYVTLHASHGSHDTPLVLPMRMDLTSQDSTELVYRIPPEALEVGEMNVFYQYARGGESLSSEALALTIDAPRTLLVPSVEHAASDGTDRQVLAGMDALGGAYVEVPDLALRPGEGLEVYWWGPEGAGRHVASAPEAAAPRRYRIPSGVVAACMEQPGAPNSRRFKVFYRIVAQDGTHVESPSVDLRVLPVPADRYSQIGCRDADGQGRIWKSRLPAAGTELAIPSWPFMPEEGQLLSIFIDGLPGGQLRDAKAVTAAERQAGRVTQALAMTVINAMSIGRPSTVKAQVSFDNGVSWHPLKPLYLTRQD